jgi:hypothetical protein
MKYKTQAIEDAKAAGYDADSKGNTRLDSQRTERISLLKRPIN